MPAQYRAIWSLPGGGTGYSVLHFAEAASQLAAQQIAADTREFFNDLSGQLPDDCVINFDSEVLDLTNDGTLTAVWAITAPAAVTGLSTAVYSRAQGARIDWGTAEIVGGRRLTGRTYVVPIKSTSFDTTGVLTVSDQTSIQDQGESFVAACALNRRLVVWSRVNATTGFVTGVTVPQQGAILRGRRD